MDLNDEKRSKQLDDLLIALSKNQSILKNEEERIDFFRQFEEVYYISDYETFRHYYSRIFATLCFINEGDESQKGDAGALDILIQNLELIVERYSPKNYDNDGNLIDISKSLRKLLDHVEMEVARMRYSDKGDWKISNDSAMKSVKAQIVNLETDLEVSNSELNTLKVSEKKMKDTLEKEFKDSVNKSKIDFVTVLGLFSGIIITFMASLVISSSILENINKASFYRLSFGVIILAIFIFNVIYSCFYFIRKLSLEEKEEKLLKMILPQIVTNVVLIILLLALGIAYYCGFVEKRNKRLNSESQLPTESYSVSDAEETDVSTICES